MLRAQENASESRNDFRSRTSRQRGLRLDLGECVAVFPATISTRDGSPLKTALELLGTQPSTQAPADETAVVVEGFARQLREGAAPDVWNLLRVFETRRRLSRAYDSAWKATEAEEVDAETYRRLGLVVCAFIEQQAPSTAAVWKLTNAVFKIADKVSPTDRELLLSLVEVPSPATLRTEMDATGGEPLRGDPSYESMVCLFSEGPIGRAYLATLRSLQIRIGKIVHLVPSKDPVSGARVGRFLPSPIRRAYARSVNRGRMLHWPRQLAREENALVRQIRDRVTSAFGFSAEVQDEAQSLRPLTDYSDSVDTLLISGYRDESLLAYLESLPQTTLLYTGGGIVRPSALRAGGHRWLHVHPGYLPSLRGADCLLWSQALEGRPSATAFFLDEGIDTGEIALRGWTPGVGTIHDDRATDTQTRYRLMYAFVDPWVRSFMLRRLVGKTALPEIQPEPQDVSDGMTFHFMHDRMRDRVFEAAFEARAARRGP